MFGKGLCQLLPDQHLDVAIYFRNGIPEAPHIRCAGLVANLENASQSRTISAPAKTANSVAACSIAARSEIASRAALFGKIVALRGFGATRSGSSSQDRDLLPLLLLLREPIVDPALGIAPAHLDFFPRSVSTGGGF
jgi:hypothetical protein